MSKGDKRRPMLIPQEMMDEHWDRIFKVRKSTPEQASTKVHVDKKREAKKRGNYE